MAVMDARFRHEIATFSCALAPPSLRNFGSGDFACVDG
jgi:hypothetical protein